jgi:HK97 family phage portal protein
MKPLTAPVQTSAPFLTRLRQGWQWVVGNKPANGFFSPGEPLPASAPVDAAGRQRDYSMLENIQVQPRQDEPVSMADLLYLADNHDVTRLAIETRKDQLTKCPWTIRKKAKQEGKTKGDIDEDLMNFFRFPDGIHSFSQWGRMVWEDMFVLDAPAVFVRRDAGGNVVAFEPVDGATITPKITAWGRTPTEGTAYTQTIKGLPAIRYGVEDLIYFPRNPRTRHAYGYGPVEQIIVTINIALRRQDYQLQYYQNGSTPDLIIQAPENWTMDQIKKLRQWWVDMMAGNSKERRAGAVIPHGSQITDTKEKALTDSADEWLARIVCYAFSLPPTPFVKMMNRGSANTAQQASLQEGLEPFKIWWKEFVEQCLLRMNRDDVELAYEQELPVDPLQRAQVFQLALGGVGHGWLDRNEVRLLEGRDPEKDPEPPTPTPGTGGQPSEAGAPAPSGEAKPATTKPASDNGQREEAKPTEKISKAQTSRRDRPAILKQEARVTKRVAAHLRKIGKAAIPGLVEAYSALGKADEDDRAKKLARAVGADDLQDMEDYLQDQSERVYAMGVQSAAKELEDRANAAMVHLANDKAIEWAEEHAGEMITDLVDATQNDIEKTVAQALTEGWSNDKLAEALGDSWAFGKDRAALIATSETAMADLAGNKALYKGAGIKEERWVAAESDACDECQALDGKTAPIDGEYEDGTAAGDIQHPGCRCDQVAVLPDEGGDE